MGRMSKCLMMLIAMIFINDPRNESVTATEMRCQNFTLGQNTSLREARFNSSNKELDICLSCRESSLIHIEASCYGRHKNEGGDCIVPIKQYHQSVLDDLHDACNGQRQCNIPLTSPYITRSTCSGYAEYVYVLYRCLHQSITAPTDYLGSPTTHSFDSSTRRAPSGFSRTFNLTSPAMWGIAFLILAVLVGIIIIIIFLLKRRNKRRNPPETPTDSDRTTDMTSKSHVAQSSNENTAEYAMIIKNTTSGETAHDTVVMDNGQYIPWDGSAHNSHGNIGDVTEMVDNEQYSAWEGK